MQTWCLRVPSSSDILSCSTSSRPRCRSARDSETCKVRSEFEQKLKNFCQHCPPFSSSVDFSQQSVVQGCFQWKWFQKLSFVQLWQMSNLLLQPFERFEFKANTWQQIHVGCLQLFLDGTSVLLKSKKISVLTQTLLFCQRLIIR